MKVIERQNNFRVSAEDLSASIGKVGAIARETGLSINELNGVTTTLVQGMGISGDEAGTATKSMLSRIYNVGSEGDGGKTMKLLNSFGVQVKDTEGNLKPLTAILGELSEKFKTLTQSEKIQIEQSIGGKND